MLANQICMYLYTQIMPNSDSALQLTFAAAIGKFQSIFALKSIHI